MKLNNRGFAITAVIYGLLILFVLLVASYLLVLSAKKNRVDTITSDLEQEYIIDVVLDNFTFPFQVPAEGKYVFSLTNNAGSVYSECTAELFTNNIIEFNNSLKINGVYVNFHELDCNYYNSIDGIANVNSITYIND